MSDSPFAKSAGAAEFFNPKDHVSDHAIVFEFKRADSEPNPFYKPDHADPAKRGEPKRDVVYADIACFRNSEDVENATPSLVKQNVKITHFVLVVDVERNNWLGKATVQTIRKAGQPFVYRDGPNDLTPAAEKAAIEWYTAREAAEASVDVPDFAA